MEKEASYNEQERLKRLKKWKEIAEFFGEGLTRDEEDYEVGWYDDDEYRWETVDEKIRELVIGLNIIGINTKISCEGHLEGVGINEVNGEKGRYVEWSSPYVSFLLGLDLLEDEERKKEQERQLAALQALIDEFYQDQKERTQGMVHLEQWSIFHIIVAGKFGENDKVVEMGGDYYDEVERKAKERLEKQQQEIANFSEFLKKKYLEIGFRIVEETNLGKGENDNSEDDDYEDWEDIEET